MKKFYVLFIMYFLLIAVYADATTRTDLINKIRHRTAELTDSTSYYSDSTASIWLNMAQATIVRLGGYIPKTTEITYASDSNIYDLPLDFVEAKSVEILSNGSWFPANLVPFFVDTPLIQVKVSWKNEDTARVLINREGIEEDYVDILYNQDSISYRLPVGFNRVETILLRKNGAWNPVFPNPGFFKDTSTYTYTIHWQNTDSAYIYIMGRDLWDNDTVRVFYKRTLQSGDKIWIDYIGTASTMDSGTAVCEVPDNKGLQEFIISETISYYLESQKRYEEAALIQRKIRLDMGIIKEQ